MAILTNHIVTAVAKTSGLLTDMGSSCCELSSPSLEKQAGSGNEPILYDDSSFLQNLLLVVVFARA